MRMSRFRVRTLMIDIAAVALIICLFRLLKPTMTAGPNLFEIIAAIEHPFALFMTIMALSVLAVVRTDLRRQG